MLSRIIKNQFGQSYKVHTLKDPIVRSNILPEQFWHPELTQQFVRNLDVPTGFWRQILVHFSTLPSANDLHHHEVNHFVSHLLIKGQIKLYPVKAPSISDRPPEKTSVKSKDGATYKFTDASTLLISNPRETKNFKSIKEAEKFINQLKPDMKQLQSISKDFGVAVSATTFNNQQQLTSAVGQAMISGEVIVIVDKTSSVPAEEKPPEQEKSTVGNRKAELGTGAVATTAAITSLQAGAAEQKTAEKPKCIYQKMTLSCRHGRSVTLDPSQLAEDGKIPRLQIVSSQNENLKDESGQPVFDILKVDASIDDVCSDHQTNFVSWADDKSKLIGQQSDGKLAKFKCPSKQIIIDSGSSVLKYLWLPNVEADGVKTFKVHAVENCDFSQFKGKGQSIQVEVFPHMKWSLNLNINLGSIKNDIKPSTNKLTFEGELKLLQDSEKADEFSADYKKKLKAFEDTLDNFKKILNNNIFDKFKDGRDIEIDVALPKIALAYDTQFKEKPGSPLVVRTHEFSFQADPLVRIAASVDILPVLVKFLSSWWSSLFNVFFDWVKQKFGEEDGKSHIQSNVSFKLSISGELGAKFSHSRDESENTKLTGEPVTSKIILKAEGEAKLDGHVYVVKVEVVLKAGLESSIETGLSMSEDDGAPYISLDFMFNGIKLYLEKEIQVKLTKNTNEASSISDDMFGEISDEILDDDEEVGTKEIKRSEPRIWLKMSDKHQFKYYLKEEDRIKIQSQKELQAEAARQKKQEQQQQFDEQMQSAKKTDEQLMNDLKQRLNNDPPKAL